MEKKKFSFRPITGHRMHFRLMRAGQRPAGFRPLTGHRMHSKTTAITVNPASFRPRTGHRMHSELADEEDLPFWFPSPQGA